MNILVLALSVAFTVGVSSFPRQPVSAVYLIPQHEVVPLLQINPLPVAIYDQGLVQETTSDEEELNLNEFASQKNPTVESQGGEENAEGPLSSTTIARSRRSTQPGAPGVGGQQGSGGGDRGGVDVSVSRGEAGGRRVEARGEGNVWQSRDGRGRVDVHGHYSRDYGGRYGTGRPQYGGGIRYSHRF